MKTTLILILQLSIILVSMPNSSPFSKENSLTYLALGDSYTIGEGVEESDRYPAQLVEKLNKTGKFNFSPPQIIAKTGWTVDELEAGIDASQVNPEGYDLVTLLIGVNNQYRGKPVAEFEKEFEALLKRAISFAKERNDHVIVVSIPDWGVTPFAIDKGSDQKKVGMEIDAYNAAKKAVCSQLCVAFVEITADYRAIGFQPEMVVADKLHPSGLVYSRWTEKLLTQVQKIKF